MLAGKTQAYPCLRLKSVIGIIFPVSLSGAIWVQLAWKPCTLCTQWTRKSAYLPLEIP